jgi:protein SCO1/2
MGMSRIKIILAVVGFAFFALAGYTLMRNWISLGYGSFHGDALDASKPPVDFTLTSAGGKQVSLRDFRGKAVYLYFGYRLCPDVCPMTLTQLKNMMAVIGPRADQVQVVMVSVDPERDTPDLIDEFVKRFDKRFVGVSGTPDQVASVAKEFGIFYQKQAGSTNTGYLVSHTASVLAVDPNGHLRVLYHPETEGVTMAADIDLLLRP